MFSILVSQWFYLSDLPVFAASCLVIWILYHLLEVKLTSEKSRAWIVMLISSSVLSVVGVIHITDTMIENRWTLSEVYTESFYSRTVLLFFLSSNVMDLVLGVNDYPKYLDPLSTIMHHIFYIIFVLLLLGHHYSTSFLLCFLMEIPTFILAIGTVYQSLRSDFAFGLSFLLTRIIYNAYLAYKLSMLSWEGVIWKTCIGVLCMHLYWFQKWVKVYGPRALSAIMKGNSVDSTHSKEIIP